MTKEPTDNYEIDDADLMDEEVIEIDAKTGKPKKSVFESIDLKLERKGEKIILPGEPKAMSFDEGIAALTRMKKAANKEYQIAEVIPAHFYDGLVALARALKEKFGFSENVDKQSWFGPIPPRFLHVKTGPGAKDFVQVPFGIFKFPGVKGEIESQYIEVKGIPMVQLVGTVRQREKRIVMEIVQLATRFAREHSIYKGRSIILDHDERNGKIDFEQPLEFFDPGRGNEIPIFSRDIEDLIDLAVLTPLANADECRRLKIPLRRGILFEGPYGCGKSLVSRKVAKVGNDHDWTFILVTNAQALTYALTFAKLYQPAIVFTEDIDRITSNRNESANDLINKIDGVVNKSDEIITVMTTNFVDRIEKAMLRPGRLDAVVSIRPPDQDAVMRLIKFYLGATLDPNSDLTKAGEMLAGDIPATIREVVERAKLGMARNKRKIVTADDVEASALSMKNHKELFEKATANHPTVDSLGEATAKAIVEPVMAGMAKSFGMSRKDK